MPVCRNCKKRIERFNKDRCPICGIEHPFEGVNSDTVEITTNIDVDSVGVDYNPRKKKKMLLYFLLIGLTGVPFFYLHKKLLGALQIVWSVLIISAVAILLWFFTPIINYFCGLCGLGAAYLVNIVIGLIIYKTPNLKDGDGEFVL